jgi:hypothetical protein
MLSVAKSGLTYSRRDGLACVPVCVARQHHTDGSEMLFHHTSRVMHKRFAELVQISDRRLQCVV